MPIKVYIIESEAGWGSKIDEIKEFSTKEEAVKFCRDYNREYNPPMAQTPNWYMYARLADDPYGPMLR